MGTSSRFVRGPAWLALLILIATHLRQQPRPGRDLAEYAGAAALALTLMLPILRVDVKGWHRQYFQEYSLKSAVSFGNWWAGKPYTSMIAEVYGSE